LCVKPNSAFPSIWGGIVGATHWLKLRACPPVLWRAGTRPALPVPRPGLDREARLNRFEGTTQVFCLRKDFLELTGKTRSGPGKSADAETVDQIYNLETLSQRVREIDFNRKDRAKRYHKSSIFNRQYSIWFRLRRVRVIPAHFDPYMNHIA